MAVADVIIEPRYNENEKLTNHESQDIPGDGTDSPISVCRAQTIVVVLPDHPSEDVLFIEEPVHLSAQTKCIVSWYSEC
jgi:hypothetical protein